MMERCFELFVICWLAFYLSWMFFFQHDLIGILKCYGNLTKAHIYLANIGTLALADRIN